MRWKESESEFITIDVNKCNGCGDCVKVCLASCYKIVNKKVKIVNLNNCMECSACWYVCLENAIDFSWPPGGRGFRTEWG